MRRGFSIEAVQGDKPGTIIVRYSTSMGCRDVELFEFCLKDGEENGRENESRRSVGNRPDTR